MTLSRDEAIVILEEIARDPRNATARIQAIKLLQEMRHGGGGTTGSRISTR